MVQNADGTTSIPTAIVKSYQAGIVGTPGTSMPIFVPPGTDPNQAVREARRGHALPFTFAVDLPLRQVDTPLRLRLYIRLCHLHSHLFACG